MNEFALGQRYIGCGKTGGKIELDKVPGNALGAYLDGGEIVVNCNAQDATGDTMNDGSITIHGNTGDAVGYAMRGGEIYVKGDAGYRAGIHMKQYKQKVPKIVIGGKCGSFLGEYQAGGIIVVLGIGCEDSIPVGNFCATGMHGGKIFLRTEHLPPDLSDRIIVSKATSADIDEIKPLIKEYCNKFGAKERVLTTSAYYVLTPNSKNPYKQLYIQN